MPYYPPSGGGGSFDPTKPGTLGATTPAPQIFTDDLEIGGGQIQGNALSLNTDSSGNIASSIQWDSNAQNVAFLGEGSFTVVGPAEFGADCVFDTNITAPSLPTSDPHVTGEFWSNLGIATISAG